MYFIILLGVLVQITGISGLQCFNCYGVTNYDPNNCFNPSLGSTFVQECNVNEVCEKRVTQVDDLQDVIDRGCSPNCGDKKFIWTDEFQVYCCQEKSLCNSALLIRPNTFTILLIALTFIINTFF